MKLQAEVIKKENKHIRKSINKGQKVTKNTNL